MRLSHAEAQALISARLDGPLDPVAERELNTHLATCDSCRAFNTSASQLARGLQTLPYLPASPAVTRAVLDHVNTPRSPIAWLTGSLPSNALPTAAAIAAAVIIVFVGAVTAFRFLDDEPSTIPAPTETNNVAQAPDQTSTVEVTVADEANTHTAPTETQPSNAGTEPASEESSTLLATEPVVTEGPTDQAAPTQEPVPTEEPAARKTEPSTVPAPTEEPSVADQNSQSRLVVATEAPTEVPAPTEETTLEPTTEPTEEPAPTEEPTVEPTEEPQPTDDPNTLQIVGPPVSPTAEPTEEPVATDTPTEQPVPTEEPTEAPVPTDQPTMEPTEEPTLEPTAEPTEEPTATPTDVPTIEPTEEPAPTEEPTVEPTPTVVPIISRDETPTETTPETEAASDGTTTEESLPTESVDTIPAEGTAQSNGDGQTIEPRNDNVTPEGSEDLPGDRTGNAGDTGETSGASLGNADVYQPISDIPGDPNARLGLSANGDLIFSTNPGRVSLESNGITVQAGDGPTGQVVEACDLQQCLDVTSASGEGTGYTDSPIGWLNGEMIYERLNGDTYPVEFRAVTIDSSLEPVEDRLIGGGESDLETLIRPYPVDGALLVPTSSSWLRISPSSVDVVDANPYSDLSMIRVNASSGQVSYVADGNLILASLSAPGSASLSIPFSGSDYDFSPDYSRIAVVTGGTIEIWDTQGNVISTLPNEEGIEIGSLGWFNEGLIFVDFTNGVLRILQP